jgi:hypothetical protein
MCGRYRLSRRKQILEEHFGTDSDEVVWAPRYNIAPTQFVPVVRQNPDTDRRELSLLRWGLVPSWSRDVSKAASMINARAETADTKPAFRDALRLRRCLIPADGLPSTGESPETLMVQMSSNSSNRSQGLKALTGHKFLLLFLLLLASLVLYPYVENGGFGYFAFRVLGSAGILIAVYALRLRSTLLLVALVLAVPALLERLLLLRADAGFLSILNIVLSFAFDVFVVVAIFHRVYTKGQPNSETVFGALCIYLLVGFTFASIYGMVAALQPRAFYLDPMTNLHAIPDRFDFIYYSFATMTSLGAAGITPVSGPARSLSVIEAILGVLYLAVLIAGLMGAYRYSASDHS